MSNQYVLAELLKNRQILKHYRDKLANGEHRSTVGALILAANKEIETVTAEIASLIGTGKFTVQELFMLLDYPTFNVEKDSSI